MKLTNNKGAAEDLKYNFESRSYYFVYLIEQNKTTSDSQKKVKSKTFFVIQTENSKTSWNFHGNVGGECEDENLFRQFREGRLSLW
jgi:hypothetical protein